MPEGDVYLCSWEREGASFRLGLEKHPEIFSLKPSFNEAYRHLWLQISEKFGDGEPYLEFPAGLPASALLLKFGNQEIVTIIGNAKAEGPVNMPQCYSGGVCGVCAKPVGSRNSVAGIYTSIPAGGGSFTKGALIHLYSERFIDLLTHEERKGLQFLEVERARKTSVPKYYELVGTAIAGYVGVKNLAGLKGTQCPQCQTRRYGYYVPDFPVHEFVARSDLPRQIPSCFVVGSSNEGLRLCMTTMRWKELARYPERKGLIGEPFGLVEDRDLERQPTLPFKKPPEAAAGSGSP